MAAPPRDQPVGYVALIEQLALDALPPRRASYVSRRSVIRFEDGIDRGTAHYPVGYAPDPTPTGHLEFALKHEGLELEVLRAAFEVIDPVELASWVRSTPTGKYTRRAWFLYEWSMGRSLDVPDAPNVAYVSVSDPAKHYTSVGRTSPRHRVRDDLLGTPEYCPIVHRTGRLDALAQKRLDERVAAVVSGHSPAVLRRAANYLYLKETKSSFEIEREAPSRQRTLRFVDLLRTVDSSPPLTEDVLVRVQNAIVDPRFAETGYRCDQNYVGQSLSGYREIVHYVSPKPEDLPALMRGWFMCAERLSNSTIDPVVQAGVLGFGFVYLHPFDDGNGRLHRYLVHRVLSQRGFTPSGLVLPVSAVMLADPRGYDAGLEAFSTPLMNRLRHELDARGVMTVEGDTARYYRHWDATRACEYLYGVLERTIEEDLVGELDFLRRFDQAWRDLREIVDMPDRRLEQFIRVGLANGGRLSKRKREQFAELTDSEVEQLEQVLSNSGLVEGE
jgi:Fic family protein